MRLLGFEIMVCLLLDFFEVIKGCFFCSFFFIDCVYNIFIYWFYNFNLFLEDVLIFNICLCRVGINLGVV